MTGMHSGESAAGALPAPDGDVTIREATLGDLPGMARVHVDGWKTAYRGIVPDRILDPLTVEIDLASGFGRGLTEPRIGAVQYVAVTSSEEVLGYAFGGPNREPRPGLDGELEALYVMSSHRGRGFGTRLVGAVARFLLSTDRVGMIVWVLAENPYRRFYERLGGAPLGTRQGAPHRLGGGPLEEVGYGWADLRQLAGEPPNTPASRSV
jgi:GNAT superfamily N-acetyltransferase